MPRISGLSESVHHDESWRLPVEQLPTRSLIFLHFLTKLEARGRAQAWPDGIAIDIEETSEYAKVVLEGHVSGPSQSLSRSR